MWSTILFLIVTITVAYGGVVPDDETALLSAAGRSTYYITYYLYNSLHPGTPFTSEETQIIPEILDGLTLFIIHGHQGSFRDSFSRNVLGAAMNNVENVIIMDWSYLAGQYYSKAAKDVPHAANDLAKILNMIILGPSLNGTPRVLHLVGFDLGAHVAGNAGFQIQNPQIDRITGLDPSSRDFGSKTRRLSENDAKYVEVLHTDGGLFGNGIGTAIGHVDFFANGGINQPGCLTNSCNHNRAWELFVASMEYQINGRRCISYAQLALATCRGNVLQFGGFEETEKRPPGMYRFNTDKFYP